MASSDICNEKLPYNIAPVHELRLYLLWQVKFLTTKKKNTNENI